MPAASLGAASPPGDGALSPRLAKLEKPAVRSLAPAAQARVLGVAPSGAGSLRREGDRVLVEVRFDRGAALAPGALRAAGARVLEVSRRYRTVTASVWPADLRSVAAVGGVASVREVLSPLLFATCPSGSVVSQGDQQLNAAQARSQLGVDGSGVTVGILSDSFDQATTSAEGGPIETHAAQDVASGDLPGSGNPCGEGAPVDVLEQLIPEPGLEASDEGRAMAQIVHDLAPGAKLAFASGFNGLFSFAQNVEWLAAPVASGGAGAQVIADDIAYLEEPFFQEGPVGVAARHVTEAGADYLSAVGNDNLIEKGGTNEIASWEAPEFRDSGECPPELVAAIPNFGEPHCMDFNPGEGPTETDDTFGITVEKGAILTVDLQWAEPWLGVHTDLDAYLLNEAGKPIKVAGEPVGSNTDNVSQTQEPAEIFQWENTEKEQEVELVIDHCAGACNPAADAGTTPRLKIALLENGIGVSRTEYPESHEGDTVGPTVFGHSGDAAVISVGAVPFFDSAEAEPYSSRGPVTHYFGPYDGNTAAAPLGSPKVLTKPDVAASDCVATSFFAFEELGQWTFCGTSAATPHAAAIAALMRQKNPGATPAQIRAALTSSARPVGTFGPDAVGAGLIDALGAVRALPPPPPGPTTSAVKPAPPAPNTFIRRHPKALVRTRKRRLRLAFAFTSDEAGARFQCKVDRGGFRSCAARFTARFKAGKHRVQVRAVNTAGTADPTPAVFRFRVKRTT